MNDEHRACRKASHQFLDEYQHYAVHRVNGGYVLAATAGSGKTRVVVHRIESLLELGVDPRRIGAFTFSRDARGEMFNRGQMLLFPKELRIGTIHSLCSEIIREDGAQWAGGDPRLDETALFYALKDIISKKYKDRDLDPGVARSLIGLAKAHCLSFHPLVGEEYAQDIIALFQERADRAWLAQYYADAFRELDQIRHQRGIIDYDDMLILAWLALTRDAGVRAKWCQRFDYMIVDEEQDSSTVQNAVMEILAERAGNIMYVGDGQQSIYRWRGANPEQFVGYGQKYEVIVLPVNYRSTKQICECATNLTAGAPWNMTGKTIPHDGATDDPKSVLGVEFNTPEEEASAIIEDIKAHLVDGRKPSEIAVLYRVTFLAYPIENALLHAGIPYVVWSGMNFFERKEVRDLLAYMRVACLRDPDESHVKRTIHAPFRYIGKVYVQEVEAFARSQGVAFLDALKLYEAPKEFQTRNGRKLYDTLLGLNGLVMKGCTASQALDYIVRETRYLSFLKKDEGEEGPDPEGGRLAHVHQLFRVAQAFHTVPEFLDYVDRTTASLNEARGNRQAEAVVLSSIHRAKGLEWPIVYGVGWNEGTLPHAKNPDQDEELRLAFVCLTRAREKFQASWCRTMVTPSGSFQGAPSQYIMRSKMPTKFLQQRNQAMQHVFAANYGGRR